MKTLVLTKGSFFRRYACVTKFSDDTYGNTRYYSTWDKAIAAAGYFSNVPQKIFVWNRLFKQWYHVHTVSRKD